MKHLGRAVYRMRATREDSRLPVLHGLKHTPDIMMEPLCESRCILPREERLQIGWFGWIATDDLNGVFPLEDTGNLVAREDHWNLASSGRQPLHQLPLGVRVRSIHFIQD